MRIPGISSGGVTGAIQASIGNQLARKQMEEQQKARRQGTMLEAVRTGLMAGELANRVYQPMEQRKLLRELPAIQTEARIDEKYRTLPINQQEAENETAELVNRSRALRPETVADLKAQFAAGRENRQAELPIRGQELLQQAAAGAINAREAEKIRRGSVLDSIGDATRAQRKEGETRIDLERRAQQTLTEPAAEKQLQRQMAIDRERARLATERGDRNVEQQTFLNEILQGQALDAAKKELPLKVQAAQELGEVDLDLFGRRGLVQNQNAMDLAKQQQSLEERAKYDYYTRGLADLEDRRSLGNYQSKADIDTRSGLQRHAGTSDIDTEHMKERGAFSFGLNEAAQSNDFGRKLDFWKQTEAPLAEANVGLTKAQTDKLTPKILSNEQGETARADIWSLVNDNVQLHNISGNAGRFLEDIATRSPDAGATNPAIVAFKNLDTVMQQRFGKGSQWSKDLFAQAQTDPMKFMQSMGDALTQMPNKDVASEAARLLLDSWRTSSGGAVGSFSDLAESGAKSMQEKSLIFGTPQPMTSGQGKALIGYVQLLALLDKLSQLPEMGAQRAPQQGR